MLDFKILIIFLSQRVDNSNSNHKICDMEAMCTHLRVYPFENGKFLKEKTFTSPKGESLDVDLLHTVDVVYTWKYVGPHILITICANEMKLCVYDAYVL